jgi:predicted PurR-regulated permease PerM
VKTPRREIVLPRGVYIVGAILISGYVMYWLRGILTPILLAFVIAYVLDPIVDQLEAWRVPRVAAIAIVLAMVLGVLVLFLALVLPSIATEVAGVIQELPRQLANLWARIGPWLEQRGVAIPHSTTELIDQLSGYVSTVASSILAPARSVLTTLMGGTVSVIGSVFAAVVVLVLAVYLLNDFDRLIAGVRELIPLRWRATVTNYAEEINQILSHFLRGQLTVMAILAVLYGGAYALLGVRLAVPIGIAAGMLNFIPYLGGAFALTAGVLMSLLDGWHTGQLVGVILAYTVVQTLEGFVITPRIIGKTVGLPEIWVLVALFIGGEIFGFLGVLLAVPAAAVAKIFVTHAVQYYRTSELYLQEPPASLPERNLTGHEGLTDASHAERGRESPTAPEGERRQF